MQPDYNKYPCTRIEPRNNRWL